MRIALIGTSHVHTQGYLEVCRDLDWVETVGVAHADVETVPLLTDLPPVFPRQEDLPPHDIAVVLTDIRSHDEICGNLSAPTVFIEKPLALNGSRAEGIAACLKTANTRADIGFFLRHSVAFQALVEASKSEEIGEIRFARLAFAHSGLSEGWLRRWPAHTTPARMGGGAFVDLAIHLIDAAQSLLGPLRAASCELDQSGHTHGGTDQASEMQGQATLTSSDGALVHLWASAIAPRVMLAIQLVGDKGEVTLEGGRVSRRYGFDAPRVLHDGPMPTPADGFRAALEALRNGRAPIVEINEAVLASIVMDSVLKVQRTQSSCRDGVPL